MRLFECCLHGLAHCSHHDRLNRIQRLFGIVSEFHLDFFVQQKTQKPQKTQQPHFQNMKGSFVKRFVKFEFDYRDP